jgi:electron transport complex protein RnfE
MAAEPGDITGADDLLRGLWRENPVFVQVLGMCPVLAVTNSAINGLTMGLATLFVLVLSNTLVSLLRDYIPRQVRIATFILIIATFVTVVDYLIQAISLELHRSLGAFISLIVVNCLILSRAEAFASRHGPLRSIMDGLGMGLGFTLALLCMGAVREILGNGSLFGAAVLPASFQPWIVMVLPGGGFFTLGAWLLLINFRKQQRSKTRVVPVEQP